MNSVTNSSFSFLHSIKQWFSQDAKFEYLSKRVDELAKKMNFNGEIKIQIRRNCNSSVEYVQKKFYGFNYVLTISKHTLQGNQEVLDFTICHEIAHMKQAKKFYNKVFAVMGLWSTLFWGFYFITNVFFGVIYGICLFSLIIPITIYFKKCSYSIDREKRADLIASETLGTAKGGISMFKEDLWNQKLNRFIFGQKLLKKITQIDISPEGNNLTDKTHPLLTERINYLVEWEKKHSLGKSVETTDDNFYDGIKNISKIITPLAIPLIALLAAYIPISYSKTCNRYSSPVDVGVCEILSFGSMSALLAGSTISSIYYLFKD
jgi:hypothetical protein